MQKIPLEPLTGQTLNVVLAGQNCTVSVYQRAGFMYLDLAVGETYLIRGLLIVPAEPILPTLAGFVGNLYMIDIQNTPAEQVSPTWDGLGSRYELFYTTEAETEELADIIEEAWG